MQNQELISWPSAHKCQQINDIIFETSLSPFGISAYNPNEPVSDFVGREKELNYFKQQISLVFNYKISRAVRLEGPGGVGKSTLFNYLKESIEHERKKDDPKTHYILKNSDVFSTYFPIPDRIVEFSDIWKPMLEGLSAGFERETGYDISLPEYVVFNLIYCLFLNDKEGISKIIWAEEKPKESLYHIEIKDIIEPLFNRGSKAVKELQDYYNENKRELRQIFKTELNSLKYEISRADNKTISELFRVIDEDDPEDYLSLILNADSSLFKSNEEIISFFNNLIRFYVCSTKKQPIFLIGIDEVAKADLQFQEDYYFNLGNLFVKLRNSLNYILFVFISTTDDWANFDKIIIKRTDLLSQINDFMKKLPLKQLEVTELIQVFKNRMNRFWKNYSHQQPVQAPYYPFSENLFEYVYRYHLRDLRKSILFLKELWVSFKYLGRIPKFETKFECMRNIRTILHEDFNPDKLKRFEWKIIRNSFNDPSRFNSNSARSSAVEKGLENAWKCFLKEEPPTITRVRNNPTITTSNKKRRPDVLIEILGNLGAEYRRNVEFQVKAYGPNAFIDLDHIESSLELFKEHYTDFIYFIITGKGLEPKAEARVKELEAKYTNRIRRPSLTENQENKLFFLALFEEITGFALGTDSEKDLILSKEVLSAILGQNIDNFIHEITILTYRKTILEDITIDDSTIEMPSDSKESKVVSPQSPITQFTEPITEQKQFSKLSEECQPDREDSNWFIEYSELELYKHELCALCAYLKSRETGKFKFKFTIPTVEKNVIIRNALLDKNNFKKLVTLMKSKNYLIPEKTSFKLTESGEELYTKIKNQNYQC